MVAVSTRGPERAAAARVDIAGVQVVDGLERAARGAGPRRRRARDPERRARRPGARGRGCRAALRRRQAAGRRRRVGGGRRAVRRGSRGAAHRLPEPALRRRAGHRGAGRGRGPRRHAVPLRDAVGAVAPGAQGALARAGQPAPRAAASCSTCTATSSTRPCGCSGLSQRSSPRSTARTTPAEDDAFLVCRHAGGVVSHLGATSLSGAPGPRVRLLGTEAAYVMADFTGEAHVWSGQADADAGHSGWLYRGDSREPVEQGGSGQADLYRAVAAALASRRPPGPRCRSTRGMPCTPSPSSMPPACRRRRSGW